MNWLIFSILAYFLLAFSYVIDKFLLSERIPKPSVYAFYVAILSFFTLFLIPFGFDQYNFSLVALSLISGIIFIYALLFFYKAVKVSQISRIAPLVGSIVSAATILIAGIFLGEKLKIPDLAGLVFLISGGLLISFDLPIKSIKIFKGFRDALIGGFLFAVAYSLFKTVYEDTTFINGFIWTRMGLFLGGLSLLLFKKHRRTIFFSFRNFHQNKKKGLSTSLIFIANKIIGGSSSLLLNYAIYLGSVTLVNAVSSLQFVFVLLLSGIVSIKYPERFEETFSFWDGMQKIGSVILIATGIILVSL